MLSTTFLLLLHLGAFTVLANEPIIDTHHLSVSKGEVLSITSPDYPDIPSYDSKINWEITVDEDHHVLLICEDIRVSPSRNCQYGYFRIFDGRKSDQYCDTTFELSVQSIENTMRLELYLNGKPGIFKCKIEAIQKQHQVNEQEQVGENYLKLGIGEDVTFKTPDYPNSPPYDTTIIWRISTDANGSLLLNCDDFRTIPTPDCVESYLMVFDGAQEHKYCEATAYILVPSTGNKMDVKFHISRTVGVLSCNVKANGAEQLLNANNDPVTTRSDFFIEKNEEISIISSDYLSTPDTEYLTWELTSEYGTQVLLQCDDFRIAEAEDCVYGYLLIFDGVSEEKHCTSDPELRVRSAGNVMRLEYKAGVPVVFNCTARAVEAQIGQTWSAGDQEKVIKLEPGKEVFDEIYFKPLEPFTNLIWNFETSPPYRISFFCSTFKLAPCNSKKPQLFVSEALNETATCGSGYDRTVAISTGNKLRIELKTGSTVNQYTLDCLVQAISGNSEFEYKNIESEEVDSSEYGRTPGKRATSCNCGRTAKKSGRIVNGELAADGEFPWMVALRRLHYDGHYLYQCGAAIISEYHVVTAAHCTEHYNASDILVYVGTINNTHAENGQIIQVKQNILRQNYNFTAFLSNDIAILVLEEQIKFTYRIGPICLTREYLTLDNQYVKAMGWGNTESKKDTWNYPQELLKTRLRVLNFKVCSFLYFREFVTGDPHRLCMWGVDTTICMGDSGSPVVWLDPETNRYTLVGVVSMQKDCSSRIPSVNAFVPYHYDWIQEIITATMPTSRTCEKI